MATIKKRMTRVSEHEFIENPNGFCLCWEWEGTNPETPRRVICVGSHDKLDEGYTTAEVIYQDYFEETDIWRTIKTQTVRATMSDYVNYNNPDTVNFPEGQLNLDPFDENGDLKPYLVPQFLMIFNIQLQLFEGFLDFIVKEKFGRNDITGNFVI